MDSRVDVKIKEHEDRIVYLEASDKEVRGRLSNLERDIHQLENTVVNESRETRLSLLGTMERQWDLIKYRDEVIDRENQREHELQKTKLERQTELFLKFGGAGSILYLFVQSMLDLFIK